MEEILTQDDVLDLIGGEGFPLEPMFNKVIITLNREENDGLVLSDKSLDEVQFIVAKGSTVRDLEAGQKVILDLEKMMVNVRTSNEDSYEQIKQIKIDPVFVNDRMYAIVEDRFIKCKDNR